MLADTIAAVATPPGEGGIGIVRLSGSEAVAIASKIFQPRRGPDFAASRSHTLRLGMIIDPATGETVDEVLACIMRAPHSYTAEDVVEINCHGGPLAVARVLQLALRYGARLAEPGEFTRRAFLNGRLDLAQAEAVLDVIRARSSQGLVAAVGQLQGKLSQKITGINDLLTGVLAAIEASLDFPEEVGEASAGELGKLHQARDEVKKLLGTWEEGRLLNEGLKIAIVGRPNVGKSSLLNALLRQERAIVSQIPGTTRDTIEETLLLGGFACRLIDTAGLRETADTLESIGVARTRQAVKEADLVLMVVDLSTGILPEDERILEEVAGKTLIVVGNKVDLVSEKKNGLESFAGLYPRVAISAREGRGLDELAQRVKEIVLGGKAVRTREDPLLTRARHRDALEKCLEHLNAAITAWEEGMPGDLIAVDLWAARDFLGEITGATAREDLLDRIFSDFCIGK
ncbi:tRNA uridine-5-carboxymethylaminomethyl(34) synthesis GTPase MnmE [Neomoorella mulderi]|uniref:tRNA modification GTPase MnmE n=1 Tax=Moorella mulderi DSM 14980 TaxID=1122241 RepID=A0A151B1G0_9FIRM|nr:tRNA uridine-5-carboxymethylaminomethyl(34) synthesis GTPase MnmE [Moorella mulderi]KYH33755.1 tRNA modification GTPase MnmE [Moorella mulderi DSM 14980]